MNGYENNRPDIPKGGRLAFGVIMVLVYIGVGILFFLDIFNIDNPTVNTVIGCLLCAYGVWRGVRLFKGWN